MDGGPEGGGATEMMVMTSPPVTPSNGRRVALCMIETVMLCAAVSFTLTPAMLTSASVDGDSHSKYTRSRHAGTHRIASVCARTGVDTHWPAAPA